MSTCKYFQVPVDPQVLENLWVFDPQLQVTRWLKPARIQVWHFELEIPVGTDPGHPRVHLCSALVLNMVFILTLNDTYVTPVTAYFPHKYFDYLHKNE